MATRVNDPEFDLKLVEDNLSRCRENIKIFSAEVEKQRSLIIDLEIMKRDLAEKVKKKQTEKEE